jgi:DNA repair exonuclease SbcCD ATPase subunit
MIIFEKLTYKNLLSTGDQGHTIDLNTGNISLVIGKNGGGKSTFIDALVYVLFGKPFRKIRLGQLINNINEKGLLVEVTFSINDNRYTVKRGMKPTVFEIYANGEMIPQPAESKIYQEILESDILRLNYKTFTQIAILGSASYKPFMQLPLGDRREIIESLLDIGVFSRMNEILKSNKKQAEFDIRELNHKIEMKNQEYRDKREFLNEFNLSKEQAISSMKKEKDDLKERIKEAKHQIKTLKDNRDAFEAEISKMTQKIEDMDDAWVVLTNLKNQAIQIDREITNICSQLDMLTGMKSELYSLEKVVKDLSDEIHEINEKKRKIEDKIISDPSSLKEEQLQIREFISANSYRLDKIVMKSIEFYEQNDVCDSCGQKIDGDFKQNSLSELRREAETIKAEIEAGNERLKEISAILEEDATLRATHTEYTNALATKAQIIDTHKETIKKLKKDIGLLEGTGITEDAYQELQKEYTHIKSEIEKIKDSCSSYDEIKRELDGYQKKFASVEQALVAANKDLEHYKERTASLRSKINEAKKKTCSVTQDMIDVIREEIKKHTTEIMEKKKILQYFDIIQKMLKDDGVKTIIIEEFLPIINGTVNMYLDKFNFPIEFMFDSKFSESIRSYNRSDFTYYSFSEGEKARIDLSILFTWRDIAIRKARSATNILIFDEVFDGSMDIDGIENFMDILGLDDSYSPIIITHDESVKTAEFPRVIEFSKDGNFSRMKETIV